MPRGKEHTCIDLFAGAGGLSLGLEMAGFKPLLCCEVNDSARETYFANRQGQDIVDIPEGAPLRTWTRNKGQLDREALAATGPLRMAKLSRHT